jgi:hypothetical protein
MNSSGHLFHTLHTDVKQLDALPIIRPVFGDCGSYHRARCAFPVSLSSLSGNIAIWVFSYLSGRALGINSYSQIAFSEDSVEVGFFWCRKDTECLFTRCRAIHLSLSYPACLLALFAQFMPYNLSLRSKRRYRAFVSLRQLGSIALRKCRQTMLAAGSSSSQSEERHPSRLALLFTQF